MQITYQLCRRYLKQVTELLDAYPVQLKQSIKFKMIVCHYNMKTQCINSMMAKREKLKLNSTTTISHHKTIITLHLAQTRYKTTDITVRTYDNISQCSSDLIHFQSTINTSPAQFI